MSRKALSVFDQELKNAEQAYNDFDPAEEDMDALRELDHDGLPVVMDTKGEC